MSTSDKIQSIIEMLKQIIFVNVTYFLYNTKLYTCECAV